MGEFSIDGCMNYEIKLDGTSLPFQPMNRLPFSRATTVQSNEIACVFQQYQTEQFDLWLSEYRTDKPVRIYATVERPLLELTFILQDGMNYRMEGLGDIQMPRSSFNFSHEPYVENQLFLKKGRAVTFDIHVKESYLQSLCVLVPALDDFINAIAKGSFSMLSKKPHLLSVGTRSMINAVLHTGEVHGTAPAYLETQIEALLLRAVSELVDQRPVLLKASAHQAAAIRELERHLALHFDEHKSIQDLAQLVAVNECTLKRLFKQQYGVGIYEYILIKRIDKAKELLAGTDMSIREMAFQLGWKNPNCLTEVFKRALGITPISYRLRS